MQYLIPYFTNSNHEFQATESRFLEILEEVEQFATQQLGLKHKIDIVIASATDHKPVEKNGGTGLTYGQDLVIFFINPNTKNLDWYNIKTTFIHELAHIINRLTSPWEKNNTLLDMMLAEGIAIVAELQIQTHPNSFTKIIEKMSNAQIQELLERLRPKLSSRDFDINIYLGHQGDIKNGIPPWAGYIVGLHLINSYLHFTGIKLEKLIHTPYTDIKKTLKTKGVL